MSKSMRSFNEGEVDSEYSYPVHMTGTATTLPHDADRDVVAELHAVIEEITGKPVEKQKRLRIGFLP